jgi:hypothetical protein
MLTKDQETDLVKIIEAAANCINILDDEIDLETISDQDIEKIANLLDCLKSNAFRLNGTPQLGNSSVDLVNKTVIGGGMFSNLYISLVTYLLGDNPTIQYATVDWNSCLLSAKNLLSTLTSLGEGDLSEIIDDFSGSEDLADLLESLGLDPNIVDAISDINEAISQLGEGDPSVDDLELIETINNAITEILNSTDDDGNSTLDSLINIIETATGEDVSGTISTQIIADEQRVSNRIQLLLANMQPPPFGEGVGLTSENMVESIADLTSGATFVLTQATNNNIVITYNITQQGLEDAIDATTADANVKTLVKKLFGITE